MAEEFTIGSVGVQIVPSVRGITRSVSAKLNAQAREIGNEVGRLLGQGIEKGLGNPLDGLNKTATKEGEKTGGTFARAFKKRVEAAAKSLPDVSIDADTSPAQREIAALRARMVELSDKTIGIDLDAGQAEAEIASLEVALGVLRASDVTIDVDVDTAGALAHLAAFRTEMSAVDDVASQSGETLNTTSGFVQRIGSSFATSGISATILIGIIGELLPLLSSVGAVAVGGAGALVSSFAAAGAGLGAFGAIAIPMFTKVKEAQKKAATAMAQYNAATTDKGRKAALARWKQANDELTSSEKRLGRAIDGLATVWSGAQKSLGPYVVKALVPFIDALKQILKYLPALVKPAAGAIQALGEALLHMVKAPGFKAFIKQLGEFGGAAIAAFGTAAIDIARGVGYIVKAFMPLAGDMLAGLVHFGMWFANFMKSFTKSEAFKQFIAYVRQNAPLLGALLIQLAQAFLNLLIGLAPLAPYILKVTIAFLALINSMGPQFWTAVAGSISAIGVFAAAFYQIPTVIQWVVGIVKTVWGGIVAAFNVVAAGVKVALGAVVAAFNWVKNIVVTVWRALWGAITRVMRPILAVLGAILRVAFRALYAVFSWFGKIALALWRVFWNTISFAAKIVWTLIRRGLNAAWRGLVAVFNWLKKVVTRIWRALWNWLRPFIMPLLNGIKHAINAAWNAIVAAFNWVKRTVSKVWHSLWGGVHKTTTSWMDKIRSVINSAVRGFKSAFQWGKNQIGKVWAGIKAITAKPVNFVIDTVYNKGIAWFFNKVAGFLHIKDRLKALPTIPGYATGGVLPGYSPNRDNMLASSPRGPVALAGGEGIINAKRVRELGPEFIHAANSGALSDAVRGGMLPGFAGGGIFDDATRWFGGAFRTGKNLLGGALGKLKDGSTWLFDHTVKNLWDKFGGKQISKYISQVGQQSGGWGKIVEQVPKSIVNKMLSYLQSFNTGGGAGQAADVIRVAKKYIGVGEHPPGSNNNIFGKRFGMNGVAWCAEYISEVFKEAGAGKAIPRSAAVATFNAKMKKRKGAPVPGDLFTYGNSHINLYEGGRKTIGGNQGDRVSEDTSHFGRRTAALVPKYAKTGRAHGGKIGHSKAAYYAFAKDQMRQMGMSVPYNWPSLKALWNRESGWNPYAVNKGSGAYGIPQALGHGRPFRLGDAGAQIAWGLNYIKNRYGNPKRAWAHSQATGWYKNGGILPDVGLFDTGGWLEPGQFAFNGLSQPEAVMTQDQLELVGKGGGRTAPNIGSVQIKVDRESDVAELIHAFSYETRRLAKGGVFGD